VAIIFEVIHPQLIKKLIPLVKYLQHRAFQSFLQRNKTVKVTTKWLAMWFVF